MLVSCYLKIIKACDENIARNGKKMMKKQGGSVKNVNKCITGRIMVLLLAVMCIQAFFTINTKAADINNIGNLEYKVQKNPEQIYSLTNGEYHPIDYPYTMQGLGENVYVINVGIRAATGGLDLSTYRCDNHYVDFLAGHVGKECVKVGANCRNETLYNCFPYGAYIGRKIVSQGNGGPQNLMSLGLGIDGSRKSIYFGSGLTGKSCINGSKLWKS